MRLSVTQHRWITMLKMLGVTALYTVLAELVMRYAATGFTNIIYPSSGLGLAAVLMGGKRYALCVYVGALLINVIANNSLLLTVSLPIGSTLEALFAAWLLTRNNKQFISLKCTQLHCNLLLLAYLHTKLRSNIAKPFRFSHHRSFI